MKDEIFFMKMKMKSNLLDATIKNLSIQEQLHTPLSLQSNCQPGIQCCSCQLYSWTPPNKPVMLYPVHMISPLSWEAT